MKRPTLVLLVALLLAAVPAAAQYTSYFQGNQITIGETEVGMTLIACENLPWSMPEIDEPWIWHGWLEATPELLTLQFDYIYWVHGGVGRIISVASADWREGKQFAWHQGLGCYAILYPNDDDPTRVNFELVTVNSETGIAEFFEGGLIFTGAPQIWWDIDPEHFLIQWEIRR